MGPTHTGVCVYWLYVGPKVELFLTRDGSRAAAAATGTLRFICSSTVLEQTCKCAVMSTAGVPLVSPGGMNPGEGGEGAKL